MRPSAICLILNCTITRNYSNHNNFKFLKNIEGKSFCFGIKNVSIPFTFFNFKIHHSKIDLICLKFISYALLVVLIKKSIFAISFSGKPFIIWQLIQNSVLSDATVQLVSN